MRLTLLPGATPTIPFQTHGRAHGQVRCVPRGPFASGQGGRPRSVSRSDAASPGAPAVQHIWVADATSRGPQQAAHMLAGPNTNDPEQGLDVAICRGSFMEPLSSIA